MRFWSEGLGKAEIVLDFATVTVNVTKEGNKVLVKGVFLEPEPWEFQMTLTKADIKGFLHVIASGAMLRYVFKNLGIGLFRLIRQRMRIKKGGEQK